MNYCIVDYISGLPIRNYSEKEIQKHSLKYKITKFDSFNILQKKISSKEIIYIINKKSMTSEVILKNTFLEEDYIYFLNYKDYLLFINKK